MAEKPNCEKTTSVTGAKRRASTRLPVLPLDHKPRGRVSGSRMGWWRAGVLIGVHVFILLHVLHWLYAGETISPIEPSEAMHTIRDGAINAGFIFFGLVILSTLIFGRFFCGWGCHVVALQDLCAWVLKKMGIRPRPFRARLLMFVPLGAALYMFVWPAVYRVVMIPSDPFPQLSWHLTKTEFWDTFPGVAVAVPFLFVCGFATVYFLGMKGYCTYGCPYGGFFALADKVASGSIRVNGNCESCGHCTALCTSNVKVHAEVRDYGMVVDPGCMKCLDCVSACPKEALYFGFGKSTIATRVRVKKAEKPRCDLTLAEEVLALVVFAVTLLSVRGIYQVIPFLMALGIASITAFLSIVSLRMFTKSAVALQNLRLKVGGRIRLQGGIFLLATAGFATLILHSGFIQYHLFVGDRHYQQAAKQGANLLDEEVLFTYGPGVVAQDNIRLGAAEAGYVHLNLSVTYGLADSGSVRMKLAWLELLQDRVDGALEQLTVARSLFDDTSTVEYYIGSIHSMRGAFAKAIPHYHAALSQSSDLVLARFKLGNALAATGRLEEAIIEWRILLESHPEHVFARQNLAGAFRAVSRFDEAIEHYRIALACDPQNAELHFQLGVTLSAAGKGREASDAFSRAVVIDSRYEAYLDIGD